MKMKKGRERLASRRLKRRDTKKGWRSILEGVCAVSNGIVSAFFVAALIVPIGGCDLGVASPRALNPAGNATENTGARIVAPPVSYSVNGRQFVAIATGGGAVIDGQVATYYPETKNRQPQPAATLFVFALPGKSD